MAMESRESINAAMVKNIPWTSMEQHGEKNLCRNCIEFSIDKMAMDGHGNLHVHGLPCWSSVTVYASGTQAVIASVPVGPEKRPPGDPRPLHQTRSDAA